MKLKACGKPKVAKRVAEIRSSTAQGRPVEEVMKELREELS